MLRPAFYFLLAVTFLVRHDLALTVTQPSSGTTWHLHSPNVVQWQSVSTDPESVEVRIVNNNPAAFPTGFTRTIKDGINTADNKFTIDSLRGLKPDRGYQVNIMSSAGTILAQSSQFAINGTAESPSTAVTPHLSSAPIPQPTLSVSAPTAAASSQATTQQKLHVKRSAFGMVLSIFAALSM